MDLDPVNNLIAQLSTIVNQLGKLNVNLILTTWLVTGVQENTL